jgi:hypothetical protein
MIVDPDVVMDEDQYVRAAGRGDARVVYGRQPGAVRERERSLQPTVEPEALQRQPKRRLCRELICRQPGGADDLDHGSVAFTDLSWPSDVSRIGWSPAGRAGDVAATRRALPFGFRAPFAECGR